MSERKIFIIGPMPPPVHGLGVVTERVSKRLILLQGWQTELIDTSSGSLSRSSLAVARKITNILAAMLKVGRARAGEGSALYIVADGGWGVMYTAFLTMVGRLKGYRLFIHHNSGYYIDHRRWRMRWLTFCAGVNCVHILVCRWAVRGFAAKYPSVGKTMILSNAFIMYEDCGRRTNEHEGLWLGHLSNLSRAKGLGLVFSTLRELLARGTNAKLVLAGPVTGHEAGEMVRKAKHEFGDKLDYRGPLYGEEKRRFHMDIDVFLFPTEYRYEAQPLVMFEAMAAAVPVIAYGRACVAQDLAQGGGIAVRPNESFVEKVVPILISYSTDKCKLMQASVAARGRFDTLHTRALQEMEQFVRSISTTYDGSGDPVNSGTV